MQRKLCQLSFADGLVSGAQNFLSEAEEFLDWDEIASELSGIYSSGTGRPSYPLLVLFKTLLLQQWYGLSDPGMEEALSDRISFRRFVGLSLSDPVPTDEEKELDVTSVYAQSKKDQEVYSLMIGKAYKIPTVACRYFNCYGPRQSLNNPYTGAAAIFSSSILNDKPPMIYEDGLQQRDMVHVKDLVRGKLTLMDNAKADHGIFNIGTGKATSILQIAEALIELCGKSFTPNVIGKFRNGDIRHCYADIAKIQALGFEPQISLKEGLKDLIAWGKDQDAVSSVEDAHQKLVEKGLVV